MATKSDATICGRPARRWLLTRVMLWAEAMAFVVGWQLVPGGFVARPAGALLSAFGAQ